MFRRLTAIIHTKMSNTIDKCNSSSSDVLKVGDRIKVVFSGGIEDETTGVVTNPYDQDTIAFKCDSPWRDTLGWHDYEAGSEHLAHRSEVTHI